MESKFLKMIAFLAYYISNTKNIDTTLRWEWEIGTPICFY